MKTITREVEIKVQDNVKKAIKWLENEYPNGVDLIYVDYRDSFDEDLSALQELLKTGYIDEVWEWYNGWENEMEIIKNYKDEIGADELSEEVNDGMREWLADNDTSNPTQDLLRNTNKQLFYIETRDYVELDNDTDRNKIVKRLQRKYAKTEEQKEEIATAINESFYGSPISFYFYLDVQDVWKALHEKKSKYIVIKDVYFSTIDRVQGSNWLGEKAVFNLTIQRQDFIDNVYLDKAEGNGYSWDEIAGMSGYDEADIETSETKKQKTILLESETSEAQRREQRLAKNWKENKECVFGDMNWNRHTGDKPYKNEYPCGNTCEDCGTFWID